MINKLSPKALRLATLVGLLVAASAAQAQMRPWTLGVSQRIDHQTNVFQSSTNEVSDTISTISLLAGLELPVGRQRIFGNVSVGAVRYQNYSLNNHNAHSANLGLAWETAGNLSGTVALDSSKTLAEFNILGGAGVTSNNGTQTQGARATVRLGGPGRLAFEAGGAYRKTDFDNPLYRSRNSEINEIFGGVRYRPAGSLVLGLGLRATRGEYPQFRLPVSGVFTPEGFDRDNVDLTAEWPLSGASQLDARISIGRDRYDTITVRDYSGLTGNVRWRWQPTGRTAITTSLARRSGDDASVSVLPGQFAYATAANRVSTTLASEVAYELTGKIRLRGGISFVDGTSVSLQTAGLALPATTASESSTGLSLGLVWEATRAIRAGCDLTHRSRGGASGYDATSFGCFGEFVLR